MRLLQISDSEGCTRGFCALAIGRRFPGALWQLYASPLRYMRVPATTREITDIVELGARECSMNHPEQLLSCDSLVHCHSPREECSGMRQVSMIRLVFISLSLLPRGRVQRSRSHSHGTAKRDA